MFSIIGDDTRFQFVATIDDLEAVVHAGSKQKIMRNEIPFQTPNSAVDAAPRQRCTQIPLVPQSQKLVITETFIDNSLRENKITAQNLEILKVKARCNMS